MSPAIIALVVCVVATFVITTLLDVHELRHTRIQRAHQRGRRYAPPVTVVLTGETSDQLITSLDMITGEPYVPLTLLVIVPASRSTPTFRATARAAKASPHRVILVADVRRRPLNVLLPRYISKGLVLVLPASHQLLPGSLATAIAYFRNPRVGSVALGARTATPRHIASALSATYRLLAPANRNATRFAPGILSRVHLRTSSLTIHSLLPGLETHATTPQLPITAALVSLIIPSLIILGVVVAPHELSLTLLCIAGPLVYLGFRASHLLGLPLLSRLSIALLAPGAAGLAGIYWAFSHLDKRSV